MSIQSMRAQNAIQCRTGDAPVPVFAWQRGVKFGSLQRSVHEGSSTHANITDHHQFARIERDAMTQGMGAAASWVGKPVSRKEDESLLCGRGRFIDDLEPVAGMRYAAILRRSE